MSNMSTRIVWRKGIVMRTDIFRKKWLFQWALSLLMLGGFSVAQAQQYVEDYARMAQSSQMSPVEAYSMTPGVYHQVSGQNSIVTAWYKMEDDPDWTYMATHRVAGRPYLFSSFYSFLENYGECGEIYTRGYWRKGYMRSAASGKWYSVSGYSFTNNDGGSSLGSGFPIYPVVNDKIKES